MLHLAGSAEADDHGRRGTAFKMWYLIEDAPAPEDSPAPKYWLGGTHPGSRIIGRKNVHIRIKATSVSRTHATIRVVPVTRNTRSVNPAHHCSTSVVLEDSSAYGTYLKYPTGHSSNRYGEVEGHHRRLDKKSPTDVQEGALLAFGAPSSWWRLGWCNIVCFANALPPSQWGRLQDVVKNAGLEVVEGFTGVVTHFITVECKTSSMKFLLALARGLQIVTPEWANTVQHTVKEACKEITEALNNTAALSISKLPQEDLFVPLFHSSDVAKFSQELLKSVFTREAMEGRVGMFKSYVFAFSGEDVRSKWSQVLQALGGETIHVGAIEGRSNVIFVRAEPSKVRGSVGGEATPELSDEVVSVFETALIKSILSGDKSQIPTAEVTAKPSKKRRWNGERKTAKCVVKDEDELAQPISTNGDQVGATEPVRKKSGKGPGRQSPRQRKAAVPVVKEENEVADTGDNERVNNAVLEEQGEGANERKFFSLRPVESSEEGVGRTRLSEHDVRRFRRKSLPRVAKVSLKRARYMQDEAKFPQRNYDRAAAKGASGEEDDS